MIRTCKIVLFVILLPVFLLAMVYRWLERVIDDESFGGIALFTLLFYTAILIGLML